MLREIGNIDIEATSKEEAKLNLSNHEQSDSSELKDYANILKQHDLQYEKKGLYLQIGEISWVQGWIIDLSVIPFQIPDLLRTILPFLIENNVCFKIVQNHKKGVAISEGDCGKELLGKVMSLYPANERQALEIARELVNMTSPFRGPRVLTDRHLGNAVYTRYGSGNPIVQITEENHESKYIYDGIGNLIKEELRIPFVLPENINWPFSELATAKAPLPETVLQDKYRPMYYLKDDFKGSVKKGLYLEKLWRIKWCVLKEGKRDINTDAYNRDMKDRLHWQFELHKELESYLPIPKVYDLFEENGDAYLAMEFIKGKSLNESVFEIFNGRMWKSLPLLDRLKLLDYSIAIITLIEQLHEKGYIHRDITPMNFLIKQNQPWMIDLELSYSAKNKKPFPPFRLGTPGFMGPEQQMTLEPTIKEDTYALGALLIYTLTGLHPDKFTTDNLAVLQKELNFFISDTVVINTILQCLVDDPVLRPDLAEVRATLEQFKENQKEINEISSPIHFHPKLFSEEAKEIISRAIMSLTQKPMLNSDDLWTTENRSAEGQETPITVSGDLYRGISGITYMLSRAFKTGFSSDGFKHVYNTNLQFVKDTYSYNLEKYPAGLYFGTAGMALGLIEGIESGLLENRQSLQNEIIAYLQNTNVTGNGVAKGLSGQGLVLLRAMNLEKSCEIETLLGNKIDQILHAQEKDGSWIAREKKNTKITGFAYGVAGIICFLTTYLKFDGGNKHVIQAVHKAIDWLFKQTHKKNKHIGWPVSNNVSHYAYNFNDGQTGILLAFIKAYELFKDLKYRSLVESVLQTYPATPVSNNITLSEGLIDWGEIYLEAAKGFNCEEWYQRAGWIESFLLHYYQLQKDGSLFWYPDGTSITNPGLMKGNSGIIHFLLRCVNPGTLSHPFLSQ